MKWTPGTGAWMPGVRQEPGRGLRLGKLEYRTLDRITHVIVHHTGVGVLARFGRDRLRFGWLDPIDAAVHVYTRIMASSGHYVVGYDGTVVQIVPEDFSAWHAGYGGERRRGVLSEWFARMRFAKRDGKDRPAWLADDRYAWWFNRWWIQCGYTSPCVWFPDLDVNGSSIGIELVSTPGRDPFPDSQLYGGAGGPGLEGLVHRLCREYGVPLDEDHVLMHSDVCPLARTTPGGEPYDPPPAKYTFQGVFGGMN